MNCCGKSSLVNVARKAQCSQTQCTGYFAGDIVKPQPVGQYELKKCVDTMHVLRERVSDRSSTDQLRSVARRMITDLEMRGTLRGAAEVFNLCVNLRKEDSLFQESLRTFMTVTFPGGAFLRRLELELDGVGCDSFSQRIPPTRRLAARSKSSKPPMVDVYGFRGKDQRVAMLSPFEFFMYWHAEAVLPPIYKEYKDKEDWPTIESDWTPDGKKQYESHKNEPYGPKLIAGI